MGVLSLVSLPGGWFCPKAARSFPCDGDLVCRCSLVLVGCLAWVLAVL